MHKSAHIFFLLFAAIITGGCASNSEIASDHYNSCMRSNLGKSYCTKSAQELKNALDKTDAQIAKIQTEADEKRKIEQETYDRSDTKNTLDTIQSAIVAAPDFVNNLQRPSNNDSDNSSENHQLHQDAIPNSSSYIQNKNSSKKTFNEASHCIKVIRAEDKNRCGRPGGMEFDVFNTCNETVKFSLPTWKQNGKLNILSIGTVQPGRSTTLWGCDLQEQYGTSMSACFERNWLKTCNVLTNADYDSSGRLTY